MKKGQQNNEPAESKPELPDDARAALPDVDNESIRRENRFSEIGRTMGKVWEERLRGLFLKWGKPEQFTLTKSQEEELFSNRIVLPVATAGITLSAPDVKDICYSQESLAGKMRKYYENPDGTNRLKIKITKKVISNWSAGHALGKNQVEAPGPLPGSKSRFSLKAWVEWFDKNLLAEKLAGTHSVNSSSGEIDEEDEIQMAAQEKKDVIMHNRWVRAQKKGEYVHRSVALATGIAAVKRLHLMVKQEDERNHPKLRREKLLELGAASDLAEKFSEWDKDQMRQATDRREHEMQSAGFDFPKEKE